MSIVTYNWTPNYSEFQTAAKRGLVTLSWGGGKRYNQVTQLIEVGTRFIFFSRPHYMSRVLNTMIYKEYAFNEIFHKIGVDLVLHNEPQGYILEGYRDLNRR